MTEKELCEAFAAGRIEKRLFWQLMREKNLPLVELRELLALLPEGTRVEVDAEEVVLTFEGIRFAFDFSQTFCRAESVLAMRGNPEQADFPEGSCLCLIICDIQRFHDCCHPT